MENKFKVKILFANNKRKIQEVSAKDELEAIDLVMEQCKKAKKKVVDIKII